MKIYLGEKNVLLDLNKEFRFYAMLGFNFVRKFFSSVVNFCCNSVGFTAISNV